MSDMDKMQADAVNRAKDMYSRRTPGYSANGFPSGYNGNMKTNPNISAEKHSRPGTPPTEPEHKHEEDPPQIDNAREHNGSTAEQENVNQPKSADFLDTVLADKEKALIILLIALLNEEKASSSLLLALMYLII
ncbi:MAG: hypothetical protein II931_06010 [Clostridia bacterium]|nr:hypothetical protein [Clostridia bacterium]